MKYALKACVAALALVAAAPAAADVVYNGNTYGEGDSFSIDFVGSAGDQFEGLEASLSLTLTDITAGGDYLFTYSLMNTTTDAGQALAELSGFGFNIDPDIDSATATGPLEVDSGNISNGTKLEFCLTAGSNCAGGSSGGVGNGDSFDGTFTLLFGGDPGLVTITSPRVRFQSTGDGEGSAIGTPTGVPEPGTWGMMLMGFGAAGYAIRRRRRSAGIPQVA